MSVKSLTEEQQRVPDYAAHNAESGRNRLLGTVCNVHIAQDCHSGCPYREPVRPASMDLLPADDIPGEDDPAVNAIRAAALAHSTGVIVEESKRSKE
jgi:hypothetical protein